MKRVVLAFCLAIASSAFADEFHSKVFDMQHSLDPIHVDSGQFLLIRNFTQDNSSSSNVDRGMIQVQLHKRTDMVTVLTAALVTSNAPQGQEEVINSIVIAGPATVTATCGSTATSCFLTYKKESQ